MRELIFLDTEATGNEPSKDRLCQICYMTERGGVKTGYFKPPIPISVKAMSITHITNKMVDDAEAFSQSEMRKELEELLKEGVLVAHNALFDIAMLKAEGLLVPRFIDTLRVVRHLDPENKIPEHNIQFLRYFLDLEVEGNAHDAESDVRVLEALFKRLYAKMQQDPTPSATASTPLLDLGEGAGSDVVIDKMIEISSHPTLFQNFIFGKYKGKLIVEVLESDRRYMEWLLGTMKAAEQSTDEDWIYTLEYYLQK